jgi:RNA polymerase sigma-70 factor, ECF subfamily
MEKVHPRLPLAKFSTKQSAPSNRFTGIHARDRPFVRRVLLRFGVPARDVDDMVQEVFVILWQHFGRLILELDPRPWLYTVAANRARNYQRLCRNTKEHFMADAPDLATTEFDPEWQIDAYRSFERLMRRLSKKLREVFVRVALRGQSIKEVAASLRIPTKTAEARMHLAREVMQRVGASVGCTRMESRAAKA